jgi:competence protein ComFC
MTRKMKFKIDASWKPKERYCLICGVDLNSFHQFSDFPVSDFSICDQCRNIFEACKKVYMIEGIEWHVLYHYTEAMERLLFRYKEQKDRVLAPVFFEEIAGKLRTMQKRYCICGLCSSDAKRMERGFEPLKDMLEVHDICFNSPLYKNIDWKQNNKVGKQREKINEILFRKDLYPLENKPILLVDDVCTTGYTIKRACQLLKPKKVLILCAHPAWQEKETRSIEKRSSFW